MREVKDYYYAAVGHTKGQQNALLFLHQIGETALLNAPAPTNRLSIVPWSSGQNKYYNET
jgi:hypothetical protein